MYLLCESVLMLSYILLYTVCPEKRETNTCVLSVLVVTGSRAVVLECQYGPRRKNHTKKATKASFYTGSSSAFRHSCPARYAASCLCLYCMLTVDDIDDERGMVGYSFCMA